MSAQGAPLRETFLANFTLVRSLAGVGSSVLDQILPRAKRFPAIFTDLRFLSSVYPNMNFHVLPPDQFPANLACHLTLPRVSPKMLLVTVAVERLESTYLALVLPPVLGLAMDLHVTSQVDPITERLVTNLARARLVVGVHAHVRLQCGLQIKPFVTDLAELGELLVVPSYVYFQVIFRGEFRAAHVAYMGCPVQRFVNVQVLLLLEHLVAHVALYRASRGNVLLLPFHRFFLSPALLPFHAPRRLFAPTSPMLEQLHLLRETLATRVASVFLLGLSQRLPSSKDRTLGSVHQQSSLRGEIFVARLASTRCRGILLLLLLLLDNARLVIDTLLDNDKPIFLVGRSRLARLIRLGCYRLHVFRSAKRQHSVSSLVIGRFLHARNENANEGSYDDVLFEQGSSREGAEFKICVLDDSVPENFIFYNPSIKGRMKIFVGEL